MTTVTKEFDLKHSTLCKKELRARPIVLNNHSPEQGFFTQYFFGIDIKAFYTTKRTGSQTMWLDDGQALAVYIELRNWLLARGILADKVRDVPEAVWPTGGFVAVKALEHLDQKLKAADKQLSETVMAAHEQSERLHIEIAELKKRIRELEGE